MTNKTSLYVTGLWLVKLTYAKYSKTRNIRTNFFHLFLGFYLVWPLYVLQTNLELFASVRLSIVY